MDRVVLGGCVLLVALGILLGLGVSAEQSTGKSIRDAMELLSFAGTAVTGVVAIIALTSWQSQFRHAEKWKSIKKLQDSLDDGRAAKAYLDALFRMIARRHSDGWESRTIDFMVDFQEEQKAWISQCILIDKVWLELSLILSQKDLDFFSVTHSEIEKGVSLVATNIIGAYLSTEEPDLAAIYNSVEACSVFSRGKTALIFKQSGILQKALVS